MSVAARPGTGRARRRFSVMVRSQPRGLVLASAGLAVAAIIGVQLGQSAISEINPIHFQGALERPQGITPPPEPPPFDPYAQAYVWSVPPPPLADCGAGCDGTWAEQTTRFVMDSSAGRDPSLPTWRDATPATQLQPWAPGEMPDAGRRLERYMRYPVDRGQADRAAAEPAPAKPETAPQTQAAVPVAAEALRPTPAVAEPVVEE